MTANNDYAKFIKVTNRICYFQLGEQEKVVGYFGFDRHNQLIQFANLLRENGFIDFEIRIAKRLVTRYEIKLRNCPKQLIKIVELLAFNLKEIKERFKEAIQEVIEVVVNTVIKAKDNVVNSVNSTVNSFSDKFDYNYFTDSYDAVLAEARIYC